MRSRWVFVSLSTLLYWCAAHALRPYVALRLDDLQAGDAFIGLAVAAFPFLSLFLAIPAGRAVDRVGVRTVLGVSYAGMAALGIGFAVVDTATPVLGLQMGNGVAELGAWLALQALASSSGTGATLTRHLALFSLSWGVGIAIGPVLGAAVYDAHGFSSLAWVYVGLTTAAALVGALAPRMEVRRDVSVTTPSLVMGTRVIARRPAVKAVLLASFVALFTNAIRSSFYPLYLERAGMPVARIGVLLSIMGVAMLAIRMVLPAMLARWSRGGVLLAGMWAEVVAMAATPVLGTWGLLVVAAAVFGAGHGLNPPITVEMMAVHTEPGERGLAMGVRVTANRLAQVLQPALFGALSVTMGLAAAFPASGLALAGIVWTAGRQLQRGRDGPGSTTGLRS